MIIVFSIAMFSVFFFFNINDTVTFSNGAIYSTSPQIKLTTPNEAKILETKVQEGEEVKKGDTLFVLENLKTQTDFNIASSDVETMTKKIGILRQLITSAEQKKSAIQNLISIQSNIYNIDRKKAQQDIAVLNNKLKISSQQSDYLNNRQRTDSLLYAKGAISKNEMIDQRSKNLDDRKSELDIKSTYSQKNYDYQNLTNNLEKSKNDLLQNKYEIESQISSYKSQIVELKSQIDNQKYNLVYIADELGKLFVISPINGTISNLFNTLQNIEVINKGDQLAILAPKKENFYSKIELPEKDLIYIKKGQQVNLKLDAYNYYKFGSIKGVIDYVSPSDTNNKFFCLVKFQSYNPKINLKAGYKLKGEVIIEEMRFYEYILKKMFNNVDDAVYPSKSNGEETPQPQTNAAKPTS